MLQPVPIADSAAEIAAWWRLVELCLPSHEEGGALTFRPSGAETFGADWERWFGEIYQPVLHPRLPVIQTAAVEQDLQRLLAEDAALGAALPTVSASGSLEAGRHLLSVYTPPQGAKLLERFREASAIDPAIGHLASVFAVRGHIFHLPTVQVAGALLLAECVLGAEAAGLTLSAPRTIDLLQQAMEHLAATPAVQLLAV
jgi:hypothetical protein